MIKVYCDWCKQEAADYSSGNFSRRIAMTENGKFNVCVNFEFPRDDRPEHVCIPCFSARLIEAGEILRTEFKEAHGKTVNDHT